MRLSFVGITPNTPQNECPAVYVDEDTGDIWFQGEQITDPDALAEVAGHSPIGANEVVLKMPPVMKAIILEAAQWYLRARQAGVRLCTHEHRNNRVQPICDGTPA